MSNTGSEELRVAEKIVSVLPAGSWMRLCSDERDAIRYAVRAPELPIRSIVLGRASLRRLVNDPSGPVKVEYLQRELREAAEHRVEFRYPRQVRRVAEKSAPPVVASVM